MLKEDTVYKHISKCRSMKTSEITNATVATTLNVLEESEEKEECKKNIIKL